MDYNDIGDIKRVLEENEVETVISVLNIQVDATPEFNLIKAAEESKTTRRYIPSIWGAGYSERYVSHGLEDLVHVPTNISMLKANWRLSTLPGRSARYCAF